MRANRTAACSGLTEGVLDAQEASALSSAPNPLGFGAGASDAFASEKMFGMNGNGFLAGV